MSGTEKLIEKIVLEAEQAADEILQKAKNDAESIRTASDKKVAEIMFSGKKKAEKLESDIILKAKKDAELLAKKQNLAVRHKMLDKAFDRAYEMLCNMDDAELCEFFENVLYAECSGKESVHPSKAHSGIVKKAVDNYNAKSSGEKLEVSEDTADIENGFVLQGKGYVKKCGFSQLLADVKEKSIGEIAEILF